MIYTRGLQSSFEGPHAALDTSNVILCWRGRVVIGSFICVH
jgi:hypothetical protein